MKVHYRAKDGETLRLLKDGRCLVAHPDKPLMVVQPNGVRRKVSAIKDPDVWPIYAAVLRELMNPTTANKQ